jgi:hypothetical protein
MKLAVMMLLCAPAFAHELRPAFVALEETPDAVEITTTWPLVDSAPRHIGVRLPDGCAPLGVAAGDSAEGRVVEHARARCPALAGAEIEIDGLTIGVPEAVVYARLRGRPPVTVVARRERPSVILGGADAPAVSFVELGVRHILWGPDHLLFVLGLLLLVLRPSDFARRGLAAVPWRRLLAAVTAFTCAHSLTLALASTGTLTLPSRSVEAAIALSIVALAAELVRVPTAGGSRPWLLAFAFGLLHGFGFAGALLEIGLPRASIFPSLLRFNIGVELGQLAFVAVAVALLALARKLAFARVERAAIYVMGTVGMYWFLGRTLALLG